LTFLGDGESDALYAFLPFSLLFFLLVFAAAHGIPRSICCLRREDHAATWAKQREASEAIGSAWARGTFKAKCRRRSSGCTTDRTQGVPKLRLEGRLRYLTFVSYGNQTRSQMRRLCAEYICAQQCVYAVAYSLGVFSRSDGFFSYGRRTRKIQDMRRFSCTSRTGL
jgi:hypothetical protein